MQSFSASSFQEKRFLECFWTDWQNLYTANFQNKIWKRNLNPQLLNICHLNFFPQKIQFHKLETFFSSASWREHFDFHKKLFTIKLLRFSQQRSEYFFPWISEKNSKKGIRNFSSEDFFFFYGEGINWWSSFSYISILFQISAKIFGSSEYL